MRNENCKGVSLRGTGPKFGVEGTPISMLPPPKFLLVMCICTLWCCECAILPSHPSLKSLLGVPSNRGKPGYSDPKICDGSTQQDNCNTAAFSFSLQLTQYKWLWGWWRLTIWVSTATSGFILNSRKYTGFIELWRVVRQSIQSI